MEGGYLSYMMTRNPYCWTIEHQKDLLENEDQNLPEDNFFVLCRIRKLYLHYYVMEDGNWRFYNCTHFDYHAGRRFYFGIEEHDTWSKILDQIIQCLHVPLMYRVDMAQDIEDKLLLILQENERSRRIPIIIDIIHRIPQIISNPYQDYHEEANKDEVGLIELEIAMNFLALEETRVFVPTIPASRDAVEALEKGKVETMNGEENFCETCMICLDNLFTEGVVELASMPCRHLFHGDCIVQWLDKNHVCPLCRSKMPVDKK